jgi:hypothetical protein
LRAVLLFFAHSYKPAMLIWLASYPRSGNTYLRLLIRSAFGLRTHTLYGSGDRRSFGATPGLLEAVGHIDDGLESQALINGAKASDHIHFVKTHEEPLTDDPAIYIVRDGRSAIVSYWHFLNEVERVHISMEAVIEGNVYAGSWSQHYANWNPDQRPHTCVLRYEELVREPQVALDAIGRVSGITGRASLPPDFATLHKMHPRFFRAADDRSNLAEAAAYQQLIDAKHGELLRKLKYII